MAGSGYAVFRSICAKESLRHIVTDKNAAAKEKILRGCIFTPSFCLPLESLFELKLISHIDVRGQCWGLLDGHGGWLVHDRTLVWRWRRWRLHRRRWVTSKGEVDGLRAHRLYGVLHLAELVLHAVKAVHGQVAELHQLGNNLRKLVDHLRQLGVS